MRLEFGTSSDRQLLGIPVRRYGLQGLRSKTDTVCVSQFGLQLKCQCQSFTLQLRFSRWSIRTVWNHSFESGSPASAGRCFCCVRILPLPSRRDSLIKVLCKSDIWRSVALSAWSLARQAGETSSDWDEFVKALHSTALGFQKKSTASLLRFSCWTSLLLKQSFPVRRWETYLLKTLRTPLCINKTLYCCHHRLNDGQEANRLISQRAFFFYISTFFHFSQGQV